MAIILSESKDSVIKVDESLRHIAFIMDGNGRWAKKRGMPREYGHKYGAETFKRVVEHCGNIGIRCVTVYAFSTENWKRPRREVDSIMKLLDEYLGEEGNEKITVRFLGDMSALDVRLREKIEKVVKETAGREFTLNVALNYGSRAEIVNACNSLLREGKTEISEDDISSRLYTGGCSDPDLIVRTGGDIRISNFLLWQAAYSELYFTDTLWPDMTDADIDRAVINFYTRKRRFGGLDKAPDDKAQN